MSETESEAVVPNAKSSADAFNLLLAVAVPLCVVGAINLLTASALAPSSKGAATFMIAAATLGSSLWFGSLHVGVVHATSAGDSSAPKRGLGIIMALAAVPSAIGVGCLAQNVTVGPEFLSSVEAGAMWIGMGTNCVWLYALRTVQGLGKARIYRRLVIVQVFVYAVGVILLLESLTPLRLFLGWYAGQALTTLIGCLCLPRVRKDDTHPIGTSLLERVNPLIRVSLASHVGSAGFQLLYRLDTIVLGFLVPASDLGFYVIATAGAELLWVLAEAMSLGIFAKTAANRLGAQEVLSKRLRSYGRLNSLVAVLIISAAWPLLHLGLPQYSSSILLLLILVPGAYVSGFARISLNALIGIGRVKEAARIGLVGAATSMLYPVSAAVGGVRGAAATSTFLYFVQAIYVRRRWRLSMT